MNYPRLTAKFRRDRGIEWSYHLHCHQDRPKSFYWISGRRKYDARSRTINLLGLLAMTAGMVGGSRFR